MPRDAFVAGLTETVLELFADGIDDPCHDEIAEAYVNKPMPKEFIEGVRKRLPKIRQQLEELHDQHVYLVNERYYVRYREAEPTTMAQAKTCLPLGYGVSAWGLRRHRGDDDLIWQATVDHGLAAGAGRLKHNADRVLDAHEEHRLSNEDAGRLLRTGYRDRAVPDRAALAQEVMNELPEGDPGGEDEEADE
jgi:hypothetical protein